MTTEIVIGIILISAALAFLLAVLFWSRFIIRFIQKHDLHSPREILKKLHERR